MSSKKLNRVHSNGTKTIREGDAIQFGKNVGVERRLKAHTQRGKRVVLLNGVLCCVQPSE